MNTPQRLVDHVPAQCHAGGVLAKCSIIVQHGSRRELLVRSTKYVLIADELMSSVRTSTNDDAHVDCPGLQPSREVVDRALVLCAEVEPELSRVAASCNQLYWLLSLGAEVFRQELLKFHKLSPLDFFNCATWRCG